MKSKTKTTDPTAAKGGPSFEQAIQRLEQIVTDMEGAELPLEDVLKKYEEGTRLVQFCSQKLEEAEKKIELLNRKADGTVTLTAFEPETEPSTAPADDAKLF